MKTELTVALQILMFRDELTDLLKTYGFERPEDCAQAMLAALNLDTVSRACNPQEDRANTEARKVVKQ